MFARTQLIMNKLVVKTFPGITTADINKFVTENAQWIADKQALYDQKREAVSSLKPQSVQWVIERTHELAKMIV